jgi:hypothetical protein
VRRIIIFDYATGMELKKREGIKLWQAAGEVSIQIFKSLRKKYAFSVHVSNKIV